LPDRLRATSAPAPVSQAEQTKGGGDDSISRRHTLSIDQFLKLSSIAESGGQAKMMIQSGQVKVNGEIEGRRRRQLVLGDVVEVGGEKWLVGSFGSDFIDWQL
jgi:ribosome-associated protein